MKSEASFSIQPEMAISPEWPIIRSSDIDVINRLGNVAIATLWTARGKLVEELRSEEKVSVVGQLYSPDGINYALRNIFSNTNIRYLILCGADLQKSGQALVSLWQEGIDENQRIRSYPQVEIDKEISSKDFDRLRENVALIDLREASTIPQIKDAVTQILPDLEPQLPWGMPEVYAPRETKSTERLPHPGGAELVREPDIGHAWLEVLHRVMRFGVADMTNYQTAARDLHNLVVVIEEGGAENLLEIPEFFPFDRESLQKYIEEFTSPVCPPGIFYTYGQRLLNYGQLEINQVEIMEEKLRIDPNDRGALAVLYDVGFDNRVDPRTRDVAKKDMRTPCLVDIQANIVSGDKLELTAHFRSQDMYGGWPSNILGIRKLQAEMAGRLGLGIGQTITFTNRAHIYSWAWPNVEQILNSYKRESRGFRQDKKGSFKVEVTDGNIVVTHMDPATGRPVEENIVWNAMRSGAAVGLGRRLEAKNVVDGIAHAFYLGGEFAVAQICARLGIPYTQDSDMIEKIIAAKLDRK